MGSLKSLLNENQDIVQAYKEGKNDTIVLKDKSVSTLNEIEQLKEKIKKENYIEHFLSINDDIERKHNFVGSLVRCTFDKAVINTSNQNILNQYGIATGSLLIASIPNSLFNNDILPHFLLLRVVSKEGEDDNTIEQLSRFDKKTLFSSENKYENNNIDLTYSSYNANKRIELPIGQSVLLNCHVLGMFYQHTDKSLNTFAFTPQIDLLLSTSHYFVYKADSVLQDVIINTQMILDAKQDKSFDYFPIGEYRETEAEAFLPPSDILPRTKVYESVGIFMNSRTANFGNTRFGKSNLNKIYATNIIKYNLLHKADSSKRIGMLIYDENGEYYHVNSQDGTSLYEKYKNVGDSISRYTLRKNENDNLMLNFYLNPLETMGALRALLNEKDGNRPIYIESFLSMDFMSLNELCVIYPESIEQLKEQGESELIQDLGTEFELHEDIFKTQLLWALLYKAGFEYKVETQNKIRTHFFDYFDSQNIKKPFEIPTTFIKIMQNIINTDSETANECGLTDSFNKNGIIKNGDGYEIQFKKMNNLLGRFIDYYLFNKNQFKDNYLFNKNQFKDKSTGIWERLDPLLEMFNSTANKGGYKKLYHLRDMHSANSQNSMWKLIKDIVENGKVCILDLSTTTNIKAKKFYAEKIDTLIFKKAEDNFSKNLTNKHPMILLNYEEAHNLFPINAPSGSIYVKIAREGAKMHIGVIYNTQFITSIYSELKSLTENTFVGYMNNQHEIADLSNVNYSFRHSGHEIMTVKRVGYMSVLTKNRRFPIRVQIDKFE